MYGLRVTTFTTDTEFLFRIVLPGLWKKFPWFMKSADDINIIVHYGYGRKKWKIAFERELQASTIITFITYHNYQQLGLWFWFKEQQERIDKNIKMYRLLVMCSGWIKELHQKCLLKLVDLEELVQLLPKNMMLSPKKPWYKDITQVCFKACQERGQRICLTTTVKSILFLTKNVNSSNFDRFVSLPDKCPYTIQRNAI